MFSIRLLLTLVDLKYFITDDYEVFFSGLYLLVFKILLSFVVDFFECWWLFLIE